MAQGVIDLSRDAGKSSPSVQQDSERSGTT